MENQQKIIHVLASTELNRMKSPLHRLLSGLNALGSKNEVLLLEDKGVSSQPDDAFKTYKVKREGFAKTVGAVKSVLRSSQAEGVHIHGLDALALGTVAANLNMTKSLVTVHSRNSRKVWSLIWRLNQRIVFATGKLKSFTSRTNRLPETKCSVVYDGLSRTGKSDSQPRRTIRKEYDIDDETIVLGNIGGLIPDQDQPTLIKAFSKLIKKKFPGFLVIHGTGLLRELLEKMIEDYQLQGKVRLLEDTFSEDEVLEDIDVLVQSTISAGYEDQVKKAMGFGLPIVATKIGDNEEICDGGQAGVLVPCGFPERIENAVMRMHVSKGAMEQLGQAAAKRFEECFTLDSTISAYAAMYQEILAK